MSEILLLLTAITFYFIGRYSKTEVIEEKIVEIKQKLSKKPQPRAGVLPFKQPEEFTSEYKNDKELEKQWIESGKADIIKS